MLHSLTELLHAGYGTATSSGVRGGPMRYVAVALALSFCVSAEPVEMDLSAWVALALDNAPGLLLQDAAVQQAAAGVSMSRSALLPSLIVGANAGHAWYSSPLVGSVDEDSYGASATLSQELLGSGGATWLELSAARRSRDAAMLEREAAVLDLELTIAESFYDVVGALGLVSAARASLDRSAGQLDRTVALHDLGAATSLELVQAQVGESRERLVLAQREQALEAAYASLYSAAGVSDRTPGELLVDTAAVLPPLDIVSAGEIPVDVEGNQGLAASRLTAEGSEISLEAARRSYWPSLSASASWSWSGSEFEPGDIPGEDSWNVRLNLSWSVFDGWMRESRIQSARAASLSSEARVRSTENGLLAAASTARNTLLNSIRSYDLALLSLDYSNRQLELSTMSYELGAMSLLDLLDAQAALAEAEAAVVTARVECLKAEARLWVITGRSPRIGE